MEKTKKLTFFEILETLKETKDYVNKYSLDYLLANTGKELEPNQCDEFYSITNYGSCEGIYTDFYVVREDGQRTHIATAKTLDESDTAYIKMHELGALLSLELMKQK